uniref:Transcription factor AP-2 C-terminal domain-containing protein n=1 Tax=Meloidogyne incognita TaxID=6306 RepID=A0A914NTN7_MELIC
MYFAKFFGPFKNVSLIIYVNNPNSFLDSTVPELNFIIFSLVEEEALHLANDFRIVLQREFPIRDSALYLNNRFIQFSNQTNDNELINRRRTMLSFARMFLKELTELMSADRSPIVDRRPELILDPSIQKRLTHFFLITHGFGGIAILAVLEVLNGCIGESLKSLEKMLQNNNIQIQSQPTTETT